ncbi:hypothetical protein MMC07_002187 [Pseudocyphellaria aurata]|nr:hypothetical protein [Pseudocyphellaria aurata]
MAVQPVFIANTILRFLQFVFAIAVLGLYGQDLRSMHKAGIKSEPRWVYAEVVGAFSAFTALVYVLPMVKSYLAFGWDVILFILWTAVFGLFGKLFIHEDPEGDGAIQRAKNAVWVDLINMLLWLVTAISGGLLFFRNRSTRSLHTGRATV